MLEIGEAPDKKSGLVGSLESSGCVGFSVVGSVTIAVRSSSVGYAVVFRVIREYLTVEPDLERFLEQQAQQTRQSTTTIMKMRPPTVVPTAILTTLLEAVLWGSAHVRKNKMKKLQRNMQQSIVHATFILF